MAECALWNRNQNPSALQATLEDVRTGAEEKYDSLAQAYGELRAQWETRGPREEDVEQIRTLIRTLEDRDAKIAAFEQRYNELHNVRHTPLSCIDITSSWAERLLHSITLEATAYTCSGKCDDGVVNSGNAAARGQLQQPLRKRWSWKAHTGSGQSNFKHPGRFRMDAKKIFIFEGRGCW